MFSKKMQWVIFENAIEDITNAIHTSSENENQLVAENASTTKDTEIVDLENEIAKLKTIKAKFEEKLESTEKEKDNLKQDIVVKCAKCKVRIENNESIEEHIC